jgi:6-phosphofructokinase
MNYQIKINEYVFSGTINALSKMHAALLLLKANGLRCITLLGGDGRYKGTAVTGQQVEMEIW